MVLIREVGMVCICGVCWWSRVGGGGVVVFL